MGREQGYSYATHLDILFPALRLIDVPALVAAAQEHRQRHVGEYRSGGGGGATQGNAGA
jgi:hypothetical protein